MCDGGIGENLRGGRELGALLRRLPREHVLVLAHVAEHRPLVALPRLSRDLRSVRRDSLFARGRASGGVRGGAAVATPNFVLVGVARPVDAPGPDVSRPPRSASKSMRFVVLSVGTSVGGTRRGRRGVEPRVIAPTDLRLDIRAGPRRVRGQGLDALRLRRLHRRVPRLLGPPDEDLAARRGAPARRGRRGRRVDLLHGAARRATARAVPRLQRRCCVRIPDLVPLSWRLTATMRACSVW